MFKLNLILSLTLLGTLLLINTLTTFLGHDFSTNSNNTTNTPYGLIVHQ